MQVGEYTETKKALFVSYIHSNHFPPLSQANADELKRRGEDGRDLYLRHLRSPLH